MLNSRSSTVGRGYMINAGDAQTVERPVSPGVTVGDAKSATAGDFLLEDPEMLAGNFAADHDNVNASSATKKRLVSLKLVYLTNFLSATGFSLLLSTVFQYLEDEAGAETAKDFMGFIIGAFSVGQIIGAPFWGYATTKMSFRTVFIISIVVRMCGNLLYAFVHSIPGDGGKKYTMLASRFIVGFGAGSMAVCNAYVAAATTMEERTGAMGLVAASGGLGFIIGPLLSIIFGGIQGNESDVLLLNYETLPAFMAVILCIINVCLLARYFHECRLQSTAMEDLGPDQTALVARGVTKGVVSTSNSVSSANDAEAEDDALIVYASPAEPQRHVQRYERARTNYTAIAALLSIYFLVYVCLSLSETVSVPLAITEFHWSKQKADVDVGIITGVLGFVAVITFILAKPLAMKYGERQVLVSSLVGVILGELVSVPIGGLPLLPDANNGTVLGVFYHYREEDRDTKFVGYGSVGAFGVGGAAMDAYEFGDTAASNSTACSYVWCNNTPRLPLWQFLLSAIVINMAWPLTNVMIFGLYSKVLGPVDQGVWMGFLNSCGSLARMCGPVVIMKLYVSCGPQIMYLAVAAVMVLTVVISAFAYRRIVPADTAT